MPRLVLDEQPKQAVTRRPKLVLDEEQGPPLSLAPPEVQWPTNGPAQQGVMTAPISDGDGGVTSVREGPDTTFRERAKKSFQRGQENIKVDMLAFKAFSGEVSDEEMLSASKIQDEINKADPIEGGNVVSDTLLKTAQILPPMIEGYGQGLKYGTAAAGTAAVAGQLGPQAAFPEELVTVPGAFGGGLAVGGMKYWSEQGTGSIYLQARKAGVSPETAKVAAAIGGPIYGWIEHSQIDKIIPGLARVKGGLSKLFIRFATNYATEVGEEVIQKGVEEVSVKAGQLIEGQIKAADVPKELKETALAMLEEGKQSLGPMAVLQLPGGVIGATRSANAARRTQQEQKAPVSPVEPRTPEGQADRTQEAPIEQQGQQASAEDANVKAVAEKFGISEDRARRILDKQAEKATEATVLKPDLSKPKTSIEKGMVQQQDEMAQPAPKAEIEAQAKPQAKPTEKGKVQQTASIEPTEQGEIIPKSLQNKKPHEIHWGIAVNDQIATSGTMVGTTEDHLAELAKGYDGRVVFSDKTFSKKQEVGDILGFTFDQIKAMQQGVKPVRAKPDQVVTKLGEVGQSVSAQAKPEATKVFMGNLEQGEKFEKYTIEGNFNRKKDATALAEKTGGEVFGYNDGKYKRGWLVANKKPSAKVKKPTPKPTSTKKKTKGARVGDVIGGAGIDTGRIKVSMEPTGKVQTAQGIIHFMERAFNIPIRGLATHKVKKYAGWFDPKSVGIRMKDVRSLTTGMHEIGHHIDRTLNNRLSKNPPNAAMAKELMAIGKALYGKTTPSGGYKSEGWAEFIREYLTGDEAQAKAPAVYKWFTETYLPKNKDIHKKLLKAKEMITSWRLQGAEARIESQISKKKIRGGLMERMEQASLWLDSAWRDELAPIQSSMKRAGIKEAELSPGENPYQVAVARADKAGAVASHFVLEYTTDLAGNYTGKGLREILKPVASDINTFTRWIVSARARFLHNKGINTGISHADANYVYNRYKSDEWKKVLREITSWNHRILDYLSEAGGLDSIAKKRIVESNPIYIPFMRAFKEGEINYKSGTGKGVAKTSRAVKKIKGSGREIIDPIESMIEQTRKIISIAHKTEVAASLAKLAERKGTASMIWRVPAPTQATQFEAEQLKKDIIRIAQEKMGLPKGEISSSMLNHWDELLTVYSNASHYYGKDNIISLVINGKKRFYEVDPVLFRAIEGLDQYTLPWSILAKPARMVRLGATGLNPGFGLIRNFLRDALTFTVLSKHAKLGPVSAATGVIADIAKTKEAQKFKALGGKMASQILSDRRALQHLKSHVLASTAMGKTVYTVSHPIDALRELFGVTEAGTRIGEFTPALKAAEKKYGEGSKDAAIYALNQAQDVTTNFSRHGRIAKVLNQMIPFFNAGIQGPDKIIRTFRARPVSTTLKVIAALTVPAIWLWWKYKDEEWYKNMPVWERNSYLHFEIPGTETVIRIPVPFELGHIFQSAPVAALDAWDKEDPKLVKEMFAESIKQANPFDWPAVISPIIDILANEDHAGRPIVPKGAEYKLPPDQYRNYTTQLMKLIGKTLNYSPAKIEHLVNSYSGGLYARVVRTIDLKNKKDITAKDMPVLTTLFLREPYAPKAQLNRFYERRDLLNQKYSSDKTSLTFAEKYERKKRNSAATELSELWKKLNDAETDYDRAKVYEKMKRQISKIKSTN